MAQRSMPNGRSRVKETGGNRDLCFSEIGAYQVDQKFSKRGISAESWKEENDELTEEGRMRRAAQERTMAGGEKRSERTVKEGLGWNAYGPREKY
jgi:hypothetical protein